MPAVNQSRFQVEIVLATYNGARFLEKQIESLFSQTCQDFHVSVRDDCSTDGTSSVLATYAAKYPERFDYVINKERLGPVANFSALLVASTAPYIMCCDQDDVWLPEKVALTLEALQKAERANSQQTPVLVYSDAVLVDANLQVISSSFWRKAKVRPRGAKLRNLLAQNLVTGCTMGCNRALLDRGLPVPAPEVVMHDYWLALVAAAFGTLVPIHKPTVLYRQHDKNAIGIGRKMKPAQRIWRLLNDRQLRKELIDAVRQARAFSNRYSASLNERQKEKLEAFQRLCGQGYVQRRWTILRYGLLRTGFLNSVGYLIRI